MQIRLAHVVSAFVAPIVLFSGALLFGIAGSGTTTSREIAAKQQRLRAVVAELASRDVTDLSADKREARARAIALLRDYGEQARFTVHHELWPRTQPLFIDDHGTRCALASVLDGFGEDAVVERLASDCNDSYVAEIADDPELARCLDELGLTIDEAAYIQDPGLHDHDHGGIPNGGLAVPPAFEGGWGGGETREVARAAEVERRAAAIRRAAEVRRVAERTRDVTTGGNVQPGDAARNADHGNGATTTGRTAPTGAATASRRSRESTALTWSDWWVANRDEFVRVRPGYHDGLAATDARAAAPSARPLRPTADEVRALVPLFLEIARDDRDVRSTAIAVAARAADAESAPLVIEAALAYLADPNQSEREWAPVMLAILGDHAACAPLAELVRDSEAGRKLMTQTAAVPEGMRALAAIAYGRCGGSIAPLLQTIADAPAAHPDVAASCVVGLGLAARELAQRADAMTFLLAELEKPTLPDAVLAQVPAALVLAHDPAALPGLFAVVSRFRGPRELRRASALALGQLAGDLDESLFDALAAIARRDVDAECRHAAIAALGLLASRHAATADHAVVAKLVAFHDDALAGAYRQDEDLPWHALAAGLFVRSQPVAGSAACAALRGLASDAGDDALRGAACLALGLARDEGAAPLLLASIEHGSELVASCATQALGLAGARETRTRLLEICRESPSESVGYSAAFALGCLADPMLIDPLVATLERTPSAAVRAALGRAIGEIGDRRAIESLERIAGDRLRDLPSRERALGALGVLAQASDVTWNTPIKQAIEPGVATPSLRLLLELY